MTAIVYQSKLKRFTALVNELEKSTPFRSWFQTILEESNNVSQGIDLFPVIDDLTEVLLKCRVFALSKDTSNAKFCYFLAFIPELVFKARVSSQLKIIKEKLNSKEKPNNSCKTVSRQKVYGCLDSSWPADSSNVVGLDDQQKKLSELIKSGSQTIPQRFVAIAIVGIGGSGKTALAQKILNGFSDQEFEIRVWVSMARHLYSKDYKSVLLALLQQLRNKSNYSPTQLDEPETKSNQSPAQLDEPETKMLHQLESDSGVVDELELLKKVRGELERRSYLIVLDGVHHVEEWLEILSFDLGEEGVISNRLAHGLPKGSGNGAVIVTTREEEATEKMVGKENIYRMDRLGDDECWRIFQNAFGDDRHQDTLSGMRKDIYSDCQGLPLVAKALGTIIRRSELATHRWD